MATYDVNNDGKVNSTDYQQLRTLIDFNSTLSQAEIDLYDFNQDGEVNNTDLTTLRQNYTTTPSDSGDAAIEALGNMIDMEAAFNEVDSLLAKFGRGTNSVADGGYVGRESAGFESYQWYTMDSQAAANDFARISGIIRQMLNMLQFYDMMNNFYYNMTLAFTDDPSGVEPPSSIATSFAKYAPNFIKYAKDMLNKTFSYVQTKNDEVYQQMTDEASRRARRGGFFRRLLNSITGADKKKEAALKLQIEQSRQGLEQKMTLAAEGIMTMAITQMVNDSFVELEESMDFDQLDEANGAIKGRTAITLGSSSLNLVLVRGDHAGANNSESATDLLRRVDKFEEVVTNVGDGGFKDIRRDTLAAVQMALTNMQARQQNVMMLIQMVMSVMGAKTRAVTGKNISDGNINMAMQANSIKWDALSTLVGRSLQQYASLVNQMNMTHSAELAYEAAKKAASMGIIGAIVVAVIAVVAVILAAPTGGSSLVLGAKIAAAAVAGLKAGAALGQSLAYQDAADSYPDFVPVKSDMQIVNALLAEMRHLSLAGSAQDNEARAIAEQEWVQEVANQLDSFQSQAQAAIAKINDSLIIDTYDGFKGIDEVALAAARTELIDIMTAQMQLFMLVKAIANAQNFITSIISNTSASSLSLGGLEGTMQQRNADLMMMADLKVDGLMKVVENNNRQNQMELQAEQLMSAGLSGLAGIAIGAGLGAVASGMAEAAQAASATASTAEAAQSATNIALVEGLAAAAPSIATSIANIAYQSQRLSALNGYLSQIQTEIVMPRIRSTGGQADQAYVDEHLESEELEERLAARFAQARLQSNEALNQMQVSNSLISIGDGNVGLDPTAISNFSTQLSQDFQAVVNALMAIETVMAGRRARMAIIFGRALRADSLSSMGSVVQQQYNNAAQIFGYRLNSIMETAQAMNQQNAAETAIADSYESIAISIATTVVQGVVSGYYAAEAAQAQKSLTQATGGTATPEQLLAETDGIASKSIYAQAGIGMLGPLYQLAKTAQIANSGFGQATDDFASQLNMTDFIDDTADRAQAQRNSEVQKAIKAMNTSLVSNAGNGYVVLNSAAFTQLSIRIDNIFDLQEKTVDLQEAITEARSAAAEAMGGTSLEMGGIFSAAKLISSIKHQNASTMLNAMKANVESYVTRSNAMQDAYKQIVQTLVSMAVTAAITAIKASETMVSERVTTLNEKGVRSELPKRASFEQAIANKMGLTGEGSRAALSALLAIIQSPSFHSILGNMVFEAIAKDKTEGKLAESDYDHTQAVSGEDADTVEAMLPGWKGMLAAALGSEQVTAQINAARISTAGIQTQSAKQNLWDSWADAYQQSLQGILEAAVMAALEEYAAKTEDPSKKVLETAKALKELADAEKILTPLNAKADAAQQQVNNATQAVKTAQKTLQDALTALDKNPNDAGLKQAAASAQANLESAEVTQTEANTNLEKVKVEQVKADQDIAKAKASLKAMQAQPTVNSYMQNLSVNSKPADLAPLVTALASNDQASSAARQLVMDALISASKAQTEALKQKPAPAVESEKEILAEKLAKLEGIKALIHAHQTSSAVPTAKQIAPIITTAASEPALLTALKLAVSTIVENRSNKPEITEFTQKLVNAISEVKTLELTAQVNELIANTTSSSNIQDLETSLNNIIARNPQTSPELVAKTLTTQIAEALKDTSSSAAKNIAPLITALNSLANEPATPAATPAATTAPTTPLVQAVAKLVQAQVVQQAVQQITQEPESDKIKEIINALPPGVQAQIAQLLPQTQRAPIANLDANGALEPGKTINPEQLVLALQASVSAPKTKGDKPQIVVNAENTVKTQQANLQTLVSALQSASPQVQTLPTIPTGQQPISPEHAQKIQELVQKVLPEIGQPPVAEPVKREAANQIAEVLQNYYGATPDGKPQPQVTNIASLLVKAVVNKEAINEDLAPLAQALVASKNHSLLAALTPVDSQTLTNTTQLSLSVFQEQLTTALGRADYPRSVLSSYNQLISQYPKIINKWFNEHPPKEVRVDADIHEFKTFNNKIPTITEAQDLQSTIKNLSELLKNPESDPELISKAMVAVFGDKLTAVDCEEVAMVTSAKALANGTPPEKIRTVYSGSHAMTAVKQADGKWLINDDPRALWDGKLAKKDNPPSRWDGKEIIFNDQLGSVEIVSPTPGMSALNVAMVSDGTGKPLEKFNRPEVSVADTQKVDNARVQELLDKMSAVFNLELVEKADPDTLLSHEALSQVPAQIKEIIKQSLAERNLSDDQLVELLVNNPQIAQAVINMMAQQFTAQDLNFRQDPQTGAVFVGEEQKPLATVVKEIVDTAFKQAFAKQPPLEQAATVAKFAVEQLEIGVSKQVPAQRMQALVTQANTHIPEFLALATAQLQEQEVLTPKELKAIANLQQEIIDSTSTSFKLSRQAELSAILIKANTRAVKTGKGLTSSVASSLDTVQQKLAAVQNTNWTAVTAPKPQGLPEITEDYLAQVRELDRKDVPEPIYKENLEAVKSAQIGLYETVKKQFKTKLEDEDCNELEALKKFDPKAEEKLPTVLAKSAQQLVRLMEKAQADGLVHSKVIVTAEQAADVLRELSAPQLAASKAASDEERYKKVLKNALRSTEGDTESKAKKLVSDLGGPQDLAPQTTYLVIKQVKEAAEESIKAGTYEYNLAVLLRAAQLIEDDQPKFNAQAVSWASKMKTVATDVLVDKVDELFDNGYGLEAVAGYLAELSPAVLAEIKPMITMQKILDLPVFKGIDNPNAKSGSLNISSQPLAGYQVGLSSFLNIFQAECPTVVMKETESSEAQEPLTINNWNGQGECLKISQETDHLGVTAFVLRKVSAAGATIDTRYVITPQRLIALQNFLALVQNKLCPDLEEEAAICLNDYIELLPSIAAENAKVLPGVCAEIRTKQLEPAEKVLASQISLLEVQENVKTVNTAGHLADIAILSKNQLSVSDQQAVASKTSQVLASIEKAGSLEEAFELCVNIANSEGATIISSKEDKDKRVPKKDAFREALLAAHHAADKALLGVG